MAAGIMDSLAARLEDPSADLKAKHETLMNLRDSLDNWCQGNLYPPFLQRCVPLLLKLLDGPPVFTSTAYEHKIRNTVLEILHRLPSIPPEPLQPFVPQLVDKLMELIRIENEDNATLCIKIIMDLQRHHTKLIYDKVQPFLDLIQEMFQNINNVVRDTFSSSSQSNTSSGSFGTSQYAASPRPGSPAVVTTGSGDGGPDSQQARHLAKGMHSFKVIAECPIVVVSVFQIYRPVVNDNVKKFVPLIKNILLLQAPPQEQAHREAAAQNTIQVGIAKDIKNRAAFVDFITAQIKTMSFLAYLLRQYGEQIKDFLPQLPDIVVRLLRDCPKERCSNRKELLVAIRHIINFNWRKVFLKSIDELLDERTLLGDGLTVHETLRPLAYSLLADLIHHVREHLNPDQIRRTVQVYTKNLRDPIPGTSFQTMSAKLLLNMAEWIAKLDDKKEARYFLIAILDAIGDKFAAMNQQYPNAVKISAQLKKMPSGEASPEDFLADKDHPPEWDQTDIFTTTPIKVTNPRERAVDPVFDNKFLFRNLVNGLKNIFYQLRTCNPPGLVDQSVAPPNWTEVASGFTAEEVKVLVKLFHEGTRMFQYYECEKWPTHGQMSLTELLGSHNVACEKEEKELLETFATIFHHVDPATFHEAFHSEIPHLYEMMFTHPAILHIPQFLLASESTSPSFAGMMLQFLMKRIEEVGSTDVIKASILLRFFKLSFMAVTLFSAHNEAVLLPHVNKLVTQSLKLSTTTESPMHYFFLLRSLFRSIGGGRFEHLYKEILPLLEMVLEVLNSLIASARKTQERDLFVELSLTVPARLSNLLPHLSYLMKPLVLALRAGSELVGQGLRTLELCVDNLTESYLDPIMAPVIDDLMNALWEHLQPHPYSHFHAHTTMRILGKLGGRNRKFLEGPPKLVFERYSDHVPRIDIMLSGSPTYHGMPAELGIDLAISKLQEIPKLPSAKINDVANKTQALKLITTHVRLLIRPDSLPSNLDQLVRTKITDICKDDTSAAPTLTRPKDRGKSVVKREMQQDQLKKLLKACLFACSVEPLKGQATEFLKNIYKHFAVLDIAQADLHAKRSEKDFDVNAGEGDVEIDHRVLVDAIVETLASDNIIIREAAEEAIMEMRRAAVTLFDSEEQIHKMPFFSDLLVTCSHSCYGEEWFTKAGGANGINILATRINLKTEFFEQKQLDTCRALMYAAKDLPDALPEATRVQALTTLDVIVRICNQSAKKEDLENPSSQLSQLSGFLVYELAHVSRHVREAAQNALAALASRVDVEVHDIIKPVKPRFFAHIFSKPLRALVHSVQIGYIEAVSYCLKLGHDLIEKEDAQMLRFLRETITLAEQQNEDDSMFSPKVTTDQRTYDNIVKLKVSCLRLLSASLDFPEFSNSPPSRGRARLVSVFFKLLYNKSLEVVDAANLALKTVLEKDPKLPKDVLQAGLRPILVSLQEPGRLSINSLSCLARMLKLLKTYFKVEIGGRLLDHVGQFASSGMLHKESFSLIEQNERIKSAVAILNIFHLLPAGAQSFMANYIDKVLEVERQLRRTQFSPAREPTIKYVNSYPKEAFEHLFKPRDRDMSRLFAQLLADDESGRLREIVMQNVSGLISALSTDGTGTEKWLGTINTISIITSLCKFERCRGTILKNDQYRKSLIEAGKSLEQYLKGPSVDPTLRIPGEQAIENVLQNVIIYLSMEPQDLDCLFEIIEAVTSQTLPQSPCLFEFIYKHVVCSNSVEHWRNIINRSVEVYTARASVEPLKAFVIRSLVNPILAMDIMRNWDRLFGPEKGTELVNTPLAEMIQNKLWKPQANIDPSDENSPQGIDQARMELLQMTAILLKYYNHLLQDFRKDTIRLGWTYIRLEDVINKHAAYVVLAYFVHHFETPSKIASQIYSQVMKAHLPEGRALVMQALEILAPVIPKRIGHNDPSKPPIWATYARRPIAEDPSNLQQMTSIFQFVARHPDLFYEAKESLAQIIIQSIYKVAQIPSPASNPSLDNKRLALHLITLIWTWEKRYSEEMSAKTTNVNGSPTSGKRKADGSPVENEAKPSQSFITSSTLRLSLVKYLVQFIVNLSDRYPMPSSRIASHSSTAAQSNEICKKALTLFYNLLSPGHWTDLDLSSMFTRIIEPNLTTDPKSDEKFDLGNTRVINTLRLLNAIFAVNSDEWVAGRLAQLQKILEKPLRNPHPEIQECLFIKAESEGELSALVPLVPRILDVIPKGTPEPDAEEEPQASPFVSFLSTIVSETLSAGNSNSGINILNALLKTNPSEIDPHFQSIMKALNQAAKDLIAPPELQQENSQQSARPAEHTGHLDPHVVEARTTMVLKIIDLLSARLTQLQDLRRPYLQVLTSLIEKSPSDPAERINLKILDLVENWIFQSSSSFPTLKEKTAVALKMICFESRSDQTLFNKFLDIIIRVYEDSKITRSELAIRLEPAFLIGTRAQDIEMRRRFMTVFNRHLTRTANKRLLYLLGVQNWEPLQETFWLSQVIELLFGSVNMDDPADLAKDDFKLANVSRALGPYMQDARVGDQMLEDGYEKFISEHQRFCTEMSEVRTKHLLEPLCFLQHLDPEVSHQVWKALLPMFWSMLTKDERSELQNGLIGLLTRDYHTRQVDKRPNCVEALLDGIASCDNPRINFPHHLMKFLARTYNAWYIAACFMERSAEEPIVNTQAVRESNLDALCEIYAGLQEDDMFYGVWRKRAQFLDSTTALSYEQYGNWEKAQKSFEHATLKARTGAIPFTQSEYMLWEDHWVFCAQKLQQWDILSDFAKNDNLNDLFLDSIWRNLEWWNSAEHRKQLEQIIKGVSDAPTPRRAFFQSFMSLLKLHAEQESATTFNRVCDEAIQLSIRKWHQLPKRITEAHVPILQNFQQLVELHDASVICQSLQQTTAQNLEHKSPELKLLLVTWRDRLPNFWDDINAWQDLVTWRQHIFQLINQRYLSLIPQPHGNNVTGGNSFAYRGYHETAWIINRFAHVARKHNLSEVCINQLSKIYTLPNIEIQEAFLKLREQAKCHYQNGELQVGLDVINNTNLNYFGPHQKAEFYTLKGMFLARQNQQEEGDNAFGAALYFDLKLPKAWAEWARYNDKLFKDDPSDITKAKNAISCYLEAAGTYKNAKSRKLLSRILWLLSLDDDQGTLVQTFEEYKGDHPVWYWITYIPQLLTSLSRPEARISASLLMKLAKQAPQALFFQLRTSRDDYQQIKRHQDMKTKQSQSKQQGQQGSPPKETGSSSRPQTANDQSTSRPGTANDEQKSMEGESNETQPKSEPQDGEQAKTIKQEDKQNGGEGSNQASDEQPNPPSSPKQPWDYIDEISSVMKTAYPLLALTMETMTDQIIRNLKCSPDEDAYRLIGALLNDSLGYVGRSPTAYSHDSKLPQNTELHIVRFKDSVLPAHIRKPFEEEFLSPPPSTYEYIQKLRKWRDRFEEKVDRRVQHTNIENYGPHLSEFKFTRFDDVEVPGQYLQHKDNNKDFIKIERFLPDIELLRGIGVCQRRLKIRGHDGSIHPFAIQHPATRTSRREERMVQMFRMWNDVLAKRKESRRRRLSFTLPAMIPCTPSLRMVQDDSSYISLQGIWEDYCRKKGTSKDEPVLFSVTRLRELNPKTPEAVTGIRLQTFEAIQNKFVPRDIVLKYFQATYQNFSDFWLFRRQFSYQLATLSFLTYVMMMRDRNPSRMFISRETGNVWGTELVPSMSTNQPLFHNGENIPFRLTPNLQTLMGTLSIEGIFSPTLLVVAKALTEPEFKLEQQLSIFIRDEVLVFFTQNHKAGITPQQLRTAVEKNTETIIKRALALAKAPEGNLPANQTVIDYISRAVNPSKLAQIDALWMPYL